MKLPEAVRRITELGWLSRQPAEFRDSLIRRCELRTYAVGNGFYGLDDPPGGIFGLVDGFVDVVLGFGPFPPFLAFVGRPGWWVGEAAAVTGTPRRTEVHARTTVQAFYLPAEQIPKLAAEDPQAWRRFAQLTVDHLDNALLFASTLSHTDVREKVLATLWRLSGAERDTDGLIELPCLQSEIAEMSGLSRNSVGPVMRRLVGEGLIEAERRRIRYSPVRVRGALR